MKALIFAAGIGKRLSPYTDYAPKCMMEIGGLTLAERMLLCLKKIGVQDVYFVVGHLKEKIQNKLGSTFEDLNLHYLLNDRYREGSILSLWVARDILESDDFLIMDADVLFPIQALERMVQSKDPNCFLLDDRFVDSGEEMKLGVRGEQVLTIARKLEDSYDKVGEGVGFLKVSKESLPSLKKKLDEFYKQGRVSCEYEELFDEWLKEEKAGYETVGDLPWTEIDFEEDLKKALKIILPKIDRLENSRRMIPINRRLSGFLTKLLLKTSLTPNQITFMSLFSGLLALSSFIQGSYTLDVIGAFLFQVTYILDNCDGEVARAKGLSSPWGSWLDIGVDGLLHILLFPAIAWGLFKQGMSPNIFYWGGTASFGIVITFVIFMFKRVLKEKEKEDYVYIPYPQVEKEIRFWHYFKAGDFSLMILFIALVGLFKPFVYLAAIGIHIFWMLVLVLKMEEAPVG